MTRSFVAVLFVGGVSLLAVSGVGGGEKQADAEKELRALEAAEAKAILESDLPALDKLWGETYTVNAPDNKIRDRKGVAEAIKAGIIKYSSFERKVEKVLLHGDTAVVMGSETVKHLGGPDDGKTVERRYTDV
jgi:hypothetical protein